MSPARAPGSGMSKVVMAMAQSATVKVLVSTELADQFEAHAHLLAPATLLSKHQTDPFRCTYYLHHPAAPPGAASAVPCYTSTEHGVRLHSMEWYDAAGRPLPTPPTGTPPTSTPPTDPPPAHAAAQ